jgi:molybdopterin molybdotransferase
MNGIPKPPPLALEEAQARLLALAGVLPIERVDVESALGHFLAEPLAARRTQPPADLSAMDGYAVTGGDLAGPWHIVGESAAGHPWSGKLRAGEAVRISTGAAVPREAGAVILQEDLRKDGQVIVLTGTPPQPESRHIRPCGMDFRQGGIILGAGTRIGPAQAALAIAAGHRHIAVRRRPRLAVIDSGDELAADAEACGPHQIPASNGAMLAAMAAGLPCVINRIGPVADDMDALARALDAASPVDVIVTSGGASVGDHDLVRPALEAWGAKIDFWRIAIKPGKPLLVATRDTASAGPPRRQIILGLPGNPVSSHVTAYLFMLPLLRGLLGAAEPLPRRIRARLAEPLHPAGGRREFLRAHWDGADITPHAVQDSGALASLAASNALIDRAAGAPATPAGEWVDAYLLAGGGLT